MLKPYMYNDKIEAGCDEAGRGCLAGPVVAAAVILPSNFIDLELNDSKKLTFSQRERLESLIIKSAVSWAVADVAAEEIDTCNILKASFLAMHRAIEKLNYKPEVLLIDGHLFTPHPTIPHECIIKGDSLYSSIAAASILAKQHRDRLMENYHSEYPEYHWKTNKGYPTVAHRKAIKEFGITPLHRKTFQLLPRQLQLF